MDQDKKSLLRTEDEIKAAIARAQKHVTRQALVSAAGTFVPIPGLDMMVDVSVLVRMTEKINSEFGLTPEQINRLTTDERLKVFESIQWVGALLVGKVISSQMAVSLLTKVGLKMTGKQVARWLPLVGQVSAAAVGFAAIRYLGEKHIEDCAKVSRQIIYLLDYNPKH